MSWCDAVHVRVIVCLVLLRPSWNLGKRKPWSKGFSRAELMPYASFPPRNSLRNGLHPRWFDRIRMECVWMLSFFCCWCSGRARVDNVLRCEVALCCMASCVGLFVGSGIWFERSCSWSDCCGVCHLLVFFVAARLPTLMMRTRAARFVSDWCRVHELGRETNADSVSVTSDLRFACCGGRLIFSTNRMLTFELRVWPPLFCAPFWNMVECVTNCHSSSHLDEENPRHNFRYDRIFYGRRVFTFITCSRLKQASNIFYHYLSISLETWVSIECCWRLDWVIKMLRSALIAGVGFIPNTLSAVPKLHKFWKVSLWTRYATPTPELFRTIWALYDTRKPACARVRECIRLCVSAQFYG